MKKKPVNVSFFSHQVYYDPSYNIRKSRLIILMNPLLKLRNLDY